VKERIKKLVEAYGPSGQEGDVRSLIKQMVSDVADEVRTDALGNLIVLKRGTGGGKRIMVAAHMDEIGVIATYVDEKGFVRFGTIGGVSPMTTVGSRVRFGNGTVGAIGYEKWFKRSAVNKAPSLEELYIDVGATSRDDCPVGVGDTGHFVRPMVEAGQRLIAKSMDDRIGCAVAIEALLTMGPSPNDIYCCFTAQEEVGTRGAMVSAYGIEPDVALAVDVTLTGDTPEADPMSVSLGEGPAIKVMDSGMLTHPGVKRWMIEAAEKLDIPYQLEVLRAGSTDARAIQRSRAGVPAGCLSIPSRYVHTPSEMVDYGDVEGAVKLLVELLEGDVTV
jgi:endoglucanase